jgi:methionyl-tRNA formyltransferase
MTSPEYRVGILSTFKAPLLPRLIQSLFNAGITGICVILDEKQLTEKDRYLWTERTAGVFDGGPSLYDFAPHGLGFFLVESHNGQDSIELIKRLGLSLLLNGGTLRKLSASVLESTPQGVINVHPGILPKFRGASCVEWAIYKDERIGNTAHFMTEGYDEGPIIKIESYNFSSHDTYTSIRTHVYRESLRLMAETVKMVLEQQWTPLDGQTQDTGELFMPIPEEKMKQVLEKISTKSYRYMRAL